jgi:RNA 3'-terminal phosphate cyclase (ATP)
LHDLRSVSLSGIGKGSFVVVLAVFENSSACFSSLGKKGKRSEVVADEVVSQIEQFMDQAGCTDQHLVDQLLIPLCLVHQPSLIRSPKITQHLQTNAEIIHQFLPTRIAITGQLGEPGTVEIYSP